MLEVLIAIVIVAFALLGMAGLQVATLRYQKTAHFRGIAAQYGAEMADRIRSNMAAAYAGNYVSEGAYGAPACAVYTAPTTACTTAACMATEDLAKWRANMSCGMAGGWGEVSGNLANDGFLLVRVYFREPSKKDTPSEDSLDTANCREAALGGASSTYKDVRCFRSVVVP